MPSAKETQRIPALFLTGVVLNWVVLFLWAWVSLRIEAVVGLLFAGTAMMFTPLLKK